MRIIRNSAYLSLGLLFLITTAMGCASGRKTTTTETTTVHNSVAVNPAPAKVEKTTTTTTTNTDTKPPQHTGILGGFFQVVGSIIAFPFIVIGNVFRAIF